MIPSMAMAHEKAVAIGLHLMSDAETRIIKYGLMAVGKRKKTVSPRASLSLAEILTLHLSALGWSQAQLAERADVSKPQLSGWLGNQTRSVSRAHINRVACAIAMGYGRGSLVGVDTLDGILNELLEAAGYAALPGTSEDLVWTRLAGSDQPELRVGWVDYFPFAYRRDSSELTGLAVEITARLGQLTGCEVEPKRLEWNEVASAIRSRSIDLLCPILMLVPTRLLHVRFSSPIPGVLLPINALVHRNYKAELLQGDPPRLISERMSVNTVVGEAGQTVSGIFAPRAQSERPHESFERACTSIMEEPVTSSGRVRCLVADETICAYWRDKNPDQLEVLFTDPSARKLRLPVAFGMHPNERQLSELVNASLDIMIQTGFIDELTRRPEYKLP